MTSRGKKQGGRQPAAAGSRGPAPVTAAARAEESSDLLSAGAREARRPLAGLLGRWGWLLVALLGALIFTPTLAYDFTYDDLVIIRDNPRIRALGDPSAYLGTSYWNRVGQNREYRPLTLLSYAATYALAGGARPFWFRLVNVIGHGLVCAAAWALARRLFGSAALATAAAALFAIHPIHVEAVAGAVGRAEIQASLGFIGALLLALRGAEAPDSGKRWAWGAAAGLAAGLAIGSKENAITILPMIAALAFFIPPPDRLKRLAPALVCAMAAAGVYMAVRVSVLGGLSGPPGEAGVSAFDNPLVELGSVSRRMTAIKLLSRYAGMLVWPFSPSADFSYGAFPVAQRVTDPGLFLGVFIGLGFLFAIWRMRKRPVFLFGAAFFLITFLITSNIFFSIGTIMGERLLYLPSVGFCICVADLALNPPESARRISARIPAARWIAVAAWSAWALALTGQTLRYMPTWRNNERLFAYMVRRTPGSARARMIYAQELMTQRRYDEALPHLEKAVEIYPNTAGTRSMLAKAYLAKNRVEEARAQLESTLRIFPVDPDATMLMARVQALSGRRDLAEKMYGPAIDANPGIPHLKLDYALLLTENAAAERDPEKARRAATMMEDYLRETRSPGDELSLLGLARAYEISGRPDRARETLRRLLALQPENAEAKKRLARLERRSAPRS